MPYEHVGPHDYEPKADAETLHHAERIKADPKRHKAALKHLESNAETAVAAHKAARKHLEKKTKKRLANAFGPKPDEKEAPQMNQDDHDTAEE